MSEPNEKLVAIAEKLLIGQFHRHVFLTLFLPRSSFKVYI